MKLSNKKYYDISAAIEAIAPGLKAVVWYDDNGIGDIKATGEIPSEAAIDAEGIKVLKAARIIEDKTEAGVRIDTPYPAYKQRNIEREAIVTANLDDVNVMNTFINGIRVKSNELEIVIEASSLDELNTMNVKDDKYWT